MTQYTLAQQAAVNCLDQTLQIIACAGSGKTQVISQRIANLLASGDIDPRNIVAFTFTEKAAAELKDRVLRLVAEKGLERVGMAEMFVGTMHGYCLDLLQRHVPETFKFGVLTEITSRMLVDRYSRQSGLTTCPKLTGPTLRRFVDSRLYLQILAILREDSVDEDGIPQGVLASFGDYLRLLHAHAYFDYTSMILLAVELLEAEASEHDPLAQAMATHIRNDLKYLVVDEYQDVNPLQERLVRGLTRYGANLCVVGDDDQTIYQWRGSEVRNIVGFADRYDEVEQVRLNENFRSSEGVVETGRSVAELIQGSRLQKRMIAAGHQTWRRGDLLALEFDSAQTEAVWICDRLQALRGLPHADGPDAKPRGLTWSDCAVLYRSVSKDADPLVDEMRRRGIPFVVKGLNRLFSSPEIQAVVRLFDYIQGSVGAAEVGDAWEAAGLVPAGASWPAAIAVLDRGRDFASATRWGSYNIQRLYLDVLESLGIREDTLPGEPGRSELVFYQLGKFSQAISDFEEIHFSSEPARKYEAFVGWLQHQAPDYYAEADGDVGYAQPDAVVISTVHQAKGMEWPAVFLPCLRRNRFPSPRMGGTNAFHVIPMQAVPDADRYRGMPDDELRLFYVAVTRSQRLLYASFSPGEGSRYARRSEYFDHLTRQTWVSTRDVGLPDVERLEPQAKVERPQVTLSFSELKYLFECPYQFKMRFLYGFNAPIHEALGYGKGLHDALAEVHKRALEDDVVSADDAVDLVQRHLHTPYAYPALREELERSAEDAIRRYLRDYGATLSRTMHSEKPIEVHLGDGVTVTGRIDLIRRLETDEVSVVDFKSTVRAQAEDVSRDQLHVYAVGYQQLTGENADLIEVLNLDKDAKSTREEVDASLLGSVGARITEAGGKLRTNHLLPHSAWCGACSTCDFKAMCPTGQAGAMNSRLVDTLE